MRKELKNTYIRPAVTINNLKAESMVVTKKGVVLRSGDFTFAQIVKEIDWKEPDE